MHKKNEESALSVLYMEEDQKYSPADIYAPKYHQNHSFWFFQYVLDVLEVFKLFILILLIKTQLLVPNL